MMQIDPSIEYTCARDGAYHIIQDLGYYDDGQRKVLIKFDNTGYEQEARLYRAIKGNVQDRSKLDVQPGTVMHSNTCGDFIFIANLGSQGTDHTMCKIKFLLTGYELITTLSSVRKGSVNDPYFPSVCGIGYLGKKYDSTHIAYATWHDMIRRCYAPNCKEYCNYGGIGITVCQRWHCFSVFADDITLLPGYNEWLMDNHYQLDKDYLQPNIPSNMKVYSPATCCFLPQSVNNRLSYLNNENAYCQYIGVTKGHNDGTYRAAMTVNGKKYNFGTYSDPVAAAYVYNNKGKMYNGNLKVINENLPPVEPGMISKSRLPITPLIKIIE